MLDDLRVLAVIPAHNEAACIADTITALITQTRIPDTICVIADNCTDDTADIARSMGAQVIITAGNTDKKAGALNYVLAPALEEAGAPDIIMGFDADSRADPEFVRNAIVTLASGLSDGLGATFLGRRGGGILGLLQRMEFARYAGHQLRRGHSCDVISGTGWAFTAQALRKIAGSRPDGRVFDQKSLAEDFELTLRARSLGLRVISPPGCRTTTDVMPELGMLASQRLRWQQGTLVELHHYGWQDFTWWMKVRQLFIYGTMPLLPATIAYLAWSYALHGLAGVNPAHAPEFAIMVAFVILEQTWGCRKAGWPAIITSLAILPDLLYGIFRQVIYVRALSRFLRGAGIAWGAGTSI